MGINRLNPDTMYHSPAFTQVATVSSGMKLIFVGGQNGITKDGKVAGDDIASQTEQALRNVAAALEAAGAGFKDVVKMTIYLVQGQSFSEGYAATTRVIPRDTPAPTVSGMLVAGLANPAYLVEIEAVAAVVE
ncbi:MAG: RidA family protein [Anaerolineae bacterium]|nr:RidA family protein [Anaerolineae bacterium]